MVQILNYLTTNNYCESYLGIEVVNYISSYVFFITAYLIYFIRSKNPLVNTHIKFIAITLILVGIGSSLHHLQANYLTTTLDFLPILIIIIDVLFLTAKYGFSNHFGQKIVILYLALIPAMYLMIYNFKFLYRPMFYLITVLILLSVKYLAHKRIVKNNIQMSFSILLFFLSSLLIFIDNLICPYFPYGVHFLWHILNSICIFLYCRSLKNIR